MKISAKTNIQDERGLSVTGLLALLVVAGLLILLGIYVRHRQVRTSASLAAQSAQSNKTGSAGSSPKASSPAKPVPSTTSPSSSAASTPSPSPDHNVINVPALGANITVPDSIKDLTYYVATNSGGHVVVNFSTQSLSANVPACAASQGSGAFDSLERGNGQYPGPANANSGGLLKQYTTYYLAYILPKGPCAKGLSPDNQSLLDAQAQDFYSSLSTVQASS